MMIGNSNRIKTEVIIFRIVIFFFQLVQLLPRFKHTSKFAERGNIRALTHIPKRRWGPQLGVRPLPGWVSLAPGSTPVVTVYLHRIRLFTCRRTAGQVCYLPETQKSGPRLSASTPRSMRRFAGRSALPWRDQ